MRAVDSRPTPMSRRVPPPSDSSHPGGHPPGLSSGGLASGTVVEQVDRLISRAIERGASAVHIEPTGGESGVASGVRVRYRIDGVLTEAGRLPASSAAGVVARIKVLASLDIAEKRRPQDGRIAFRPRIGRALGNGASGEAVDLRVSVLPTTAGEKVVLEILDWRSHCSCPVSGVRHVLSVAAVPRASLLDESTRKPLGQRLRRVLLRIAEVRPRPVQPSGNSRAQSEPLGYIKAVYSRR